MNFKFYYRQNCHLCEDMYQLIHPYLSTYDVKLEMFNIDQDPQLQKEYGLLIPVLNDDQDNEVCHYFFDKVTFEKLLLESKC